MSYEPGMSGLVHGAPLIVEDLDVTMKVSTFVSPRYATEREVNRLHSKIRRAKVNYSFEYKPTRLRDTGILLWNYKFVVGDRTLLYLALWP